MANERTESELVDLQPSKIALEESMTPQQQERATRNRTAQLLKRKQISEKRQRQLGCDSLSKRIDLPNRLIDTHAGFFFEATQDDLPSRNDSSVRVVDDPPPISRDSDIHKCQGCSASFFYSYLMKHFDEPVCDGCRSKDDKHALITKTEAKHIYLLKDCDFDRREPKLRCLFRKNPHNVRWGEMRLYLKKQVEERALVVWGTLDDLEEARSLRDDGKQKKKQKKFDKKLKELRMRVRSSLWTKDLGQRHCHVFGDEVQLDEDTYRKSCECGHSVTYEKM